MGSQSQTPLNDWAHPYFIQWELRRTEAQELARASHTVRAVCRQPGAAWPGLAGSGGPQKEEYLSGD